MSYLITKKSLIFLYISCCIGFFYYLASYNWFTSFIEVLDKDSSVSHYKLIQIWVQGDRGIDGKVNPITANDQSFAEWKKIMDDFFKVASVYKKKPVQYELILDDLTINKHKKIFDEWKEKYPNNFNIVRVNDIIDQHPETSLYLEHCSFGNPALCSDVIRVLKIFEPNTRVVYIDFDFLIQLYQCRDFFILNRKNRPAVKSELALGLAVDDKKIHSTQFVSFKEGRLFFNNDLIVCSGENELEYLRLKKEMLRRLKKNDYYLGYITKRSSFMNGSFEKYKEHRLSLVNEMKLRPDNTINYVRVVIGTTGPGLYLHLQRMEVLAPYRVPVNISSATWSDGLGSSRGVITPNIIKESFGKEKLDLFLNLMVTNNDCFYAKKKNLKITEDLKNELNMLFNQITPDQKKYLKTISADVYESIERNLNEG